MADPTLPPLLALPRELRDMIIDDVLLSPILGPTPASLKMSPDEHPKRWNTTEIPPIPPLNGLVHANAQLRAETHQRAAKLDTPLILDILVLENGYIKCTWIGRPCKEPNKWQKIDMKVQVRTQPISMKLWEACHPTQETYHANNFDYANRTDNMCDFARRWGRVQGRNLGYLVTFAVSKAVIGVLWADLPGMNSCVSSQGRTPDRDGTLGPINSINHIAVEIVPAQDEAGRVLESPYWGSNYQRDELCYTRRDLRFLGYDNPDPHYDPNEDPEDLQEWLLDCIETVWSASPADASIIAVQNYEADHQPLLTHIGAFIINIYTSGREGRSEKSTELSFSGIVRGNPGFWEHDLDNKIGLFRKAMGWDD